MKKTFLILLLFLVLGAEAQSFRERIFLVRYKRYLQKDARKEKKLEWDWSGLRKQYGPDIGEYHPDIYKLNALIKKKCKDVRCCGCDSLLLWRAKQISAFERYYLPQAYSDDSIVLLLRPLDFEIAKVSWYVRAAMQKYKEGIPFLKFLISKDPESGYWYESLAQCYTQTGKPDSAVFVLTEGIGKTPKDLLYEGHVGSLYLNRARVFAKLKKCKEALQDINAYRKHGADGSFETSLYILFMLEDLHDNALALKVCDSLIKKIPPDFMANGKWEYKDGSFVTPLEPEADLYFNRGLIYYKQGEVQKAAVDWMSANDICTFSHEMGYKGRYYFDSASKAHPEITLFKYLYTQYTYRHDVYGADDKDWEWQRVPYIRDSILPKVISLMDSSDYRCWYALAEIQADMGDNPAALSSISKAIELRPDDPRLYKERARIKVLLGLSSAGDEKMYLKTKKSFVYFAEK